MTPAEDQSATVAAVALAVSVARVEGAVSGLVSDIGEIKSSMSRLTDAVTKLAVVEARQTEADKATDRAFLEINKLDGRISSLSVRTSELENAQPIQQQTTDWVQKIVWIIVVAVVGALIGIVLIAPRADALKASGDFKVMPK